MLLYTSENTPAHAKAEAEAAQRERLLAWMAEQESNCICDETKLEDNPTHVLSRIGTPLHANELEKRLKVLNPSLSFRWHDFNSTKKGMYQAGEYLFPYESGIMPERSIMAMHEEMAPDPIVFTPGFVIERSEFKEDGTNPYYRKVRKVWNERQRGWRTVLLKLVKCGALTPTQVETAFGSSNTREWQGHLGKARVTTPW